MLHRAAAYCSASERCIQDVEKKIKAAGLAGEGKRPDRFPPATRTFHRRKPLCTLFRKRQITLQQMGTCQDQLRDAAERHSVQYPLGSTGRYRRTRISLHPSFSPEKQKESNPWEGRSGSLRQTAPLRRRTRFRNKGNKPLPETTVQRE